MKKYNNENNQEIINAIKGDYVVSFSSNGFDFEDYAVDDLDYFIDKKMGELTAQEQEKAVYHTYTKKAYIAEMCWDMKREDNEEYYEERLDYLKRL